MRATRRSTILALVCLLGLHEVVLGQDIRRVSMSEAIGMFGRQSLALRIARAELAERTGRARQSRAYFNPAVTVVREDLGFSGEEYRETTVGLSQQIEWPGRTVARNRTAGHEAAAAQSSFRADSVRLAFEARVAYARTWVAEEAEIAVRRATEVIRAVAEAAERRLEAGDISAYEARRLRLERVRIEGDLAAAGLASAAARRTLATLISPDVEGLEMGPAHGLSDVPPPVGRESALEALSRRPDLVAAARSLDAARAGATAAGQAWVPSPTLTLGYKDQSDGFSGASLGLSLPIPFFDRGGGALDGARARESGAAASLDLKTREARNDLLDAADRHVSSRGRLIAVGQVLTEDADALLEAARAAYDDGEMTLVELLDAAGAYRSARDSDVSLRSTAWIAYYDVLRAMGRAPEEDR